MLIYEFFWHFFGTFKAIVVQEQLEREKERKVWEYGERASTQYTYITGIVQWLPSYNILFLTFMYNEEGNNIG